MPFLFVGFESHRREATTSLVQTMAQNVAQNVAQTAAHPYRLSRDDKVAPFFTERVVEDDWNFSSPSTPILITTHCVPTKLIRAR